MKQRKIPMRKCVITGEKKPKKELIRIVRGTDGEVSVDTTGKKNVLSRHLEVEVPESIYEELAKQAQKQVK